MNRISIYCAIINKLDIGLEQCFSITSMQHFPELIESKALSSRNFYHLQVLFLLYHKLLHNQHIGNIIIIHFVIPFKFNLIQDFYILNLLVLSLKALNLRPYCA